MKKIKILIADNSYIIRKGFYSLIDPIKDFSMVGDAAKATDLSEKLLRYDPDILVIDYASHFFCIDDISIIRQYFPKVKILAITNPQSKLIISKAIEDGVVSHLFKDSTEQEIVEAIYCTAKGKKFMCGKIIDLLSANLNTNLDRKQISRKKSKA